MSPLEKQDLVFFWTGSPALPGLFTFCFNFLHCSILFNFKVKPAKDDGGETLKKRLQKKKTQRGQRFLFTIFSSFVYFFSASEDGFQPMPSVTIRPADDNHLPSANTCISRLYVPLYSSKAVLKSKLLMAIKTKNFGFV